MQPHQRLPIEGIVVQRPLRLGIVGVGALAQRIVPLLASPEFLSAITVTHLCDPAPGRAEQAAIQHGVPRWSSTLDELLADHEVDAVTVATPIGLHFEQGLAAIRAGKHVHFNKTMTVTAADASAVIAEAATTGVRIVASPGEVLRPQLREVKRLIETGAIGDICWAACGAAFGNYHVSESEREGTDALGGLDPSWYFRSPGGGPLYDMTVYALHGITGVLGSVERVTAMSGVRITERHFGGRVITPDSDDNTLILLDFGSNTFGLAYGTASGILTEGVNWDSSGRYYGTSGSIVGTNMNGNPIEFPGRALAESAPGGDQWLLPHMSPSILPVPELHVVEDILQLADWVRLDKPSQVTGEHARHVIEIIEAAYAAARCGRTQDLRTTVTGLRG